MKKFYYGLLFIAISISMTLNAQPPQGFRYQAVVRDSDGDLVKNQKVSYEIAILSGSATGSIVYTETHVDTTNNYGVSNLVIGQGTPGTGTFNSINWGGSDYFLRVSVDISGGTSYLVMGTTQLLSVPYALYAKAATNANVANVANHVDWDNISDTPQTLSGYGISNPYQVTVKNVGCHTLASVGSTYTKIGNIATFTKLNDGSMVEIIFRGRLGVTDVTSLGAKFELRVDDETSTIGPARVLVRQEEEGVQGISTTLAGYFEGLSTGTHTISIWGRASASGSITNMRINPNCFSDMDAVTIKEFK